MADGAAADSVCGFATGRTTTLLLDADGTLFPSEESAFEASALVTQALADHYRLAGDFRPGALRVESTGKNFRSTVGELLAAAGVSAAPADVERWIEREMLEVTAHLRATLRPSAQVSAALTRLSRRFRLAAVSSSASTRLTACFTACELDELVPPAVRYSAEDSLPSPLGKPDPAIYRHALAELGVAADEAVAIEDSGSGVTSAVGAGIRTLGIVQYVPPAERAERARQLRAAGAVAVVENWDDLADGLTSSR